MNALDMQMLKFTCAAYNCKLAIKDSQYTKLFPRFCREADFSIKPHSISMTRLCNRKSNYCNKKKSCLLEFSCWTSVNAMCVVDLFFFAFSFSLCFVSMSVESKNWSMYVCCVHCSNVFEWNTFAENTKKKGKSTQ